MRYAFLLVALTVVLVLPASGGSATTGKPWLWQCTQIHNLEAQYRCYVRLLREDIDASGNPAKELPRIDRRVFAVGGPVEASCHVLMHQVGREFARDHRVTLASLQRYVPRSNNPNCSAGFGMGLVMYLAPRFSVREGRRLCVRARSCRRDIAPTPACTGSVTRCSARITATSVRPCAPVARCSTPTRPTARRVSSTTTGSLSAAPTGRRSPGGALTTRAVRRTPDLRQTMLVPLLPRAAGFAAGSERGRPAPVVSWSAFDRAVRLYQRGRAHDLVEPVRPDPGLCASARGGRCSLPARRSRSGAGGKAGGAAAVDPRVRPHRTRRATRMLRVVGANARRRHERSVPRKRVHEARPRCAGCMCRRRAEDERRPSDVLLGGFTGGLAEDPRPRL